METNQSNVKKEEEISEFKKFMTSYTGQLVTSFIIIVVLMIPASQVGYLISERQQRQEGVTEELKGEWGPEVELKGIVLEVPKNNKPEDVLYIFPEKSEEKIDVNVSERYRGIFKANLYSAKINSKSIFQLDKVRKNSDNANLNWSNARVILLSGRDTRFTELSKFLVNGKSLEIAGQTVKSNVLQSYSNRFGIDPTISSIEINYNADVNGTQTIYYKPIASRSTMNLKTNWMDPAFSGNSLPVNGSFKKNQNSVEATWKNLSSIGSGSRTSTNSIQSGTRNLSEIKFITLLDQYQLNDRTIKYAILVFTLTFGIFFLVQIIGKTNLHPIHYLMIGLALLLFYSLLLSLSEHLGFNNAYLIAAATIVGLVVWYAKAILNSIKLAIMCGLSLTILYGFLLVLVNLEVYALLVGSIGLLFVLAAIMSVTRRLNLN